MSSPSTKTSTFPIKSSLCIRVLRVVFILLSNEYFFSCFKEIKNIDNTDDEIFDLNEVSGYFEYEVYGWGSDNSN